MLENGDLPGDVIVNILLKLPIKSLLRFRAVCRSWYVFLTGPDFIQKHLRHNTIEKLVSQSYHFATFLTIGDGYNNNDISPFPFNPDGEMHFEDSCNGLVCLSFKDRPHIILWNPATQEYRFIGLPGYSLFSEAFSCIGLGFLPEIYDYKIFRISMKSNTINDNMDLLIYSLRSDSWKRTEVLPCDSMILGPPTLINECIHWISIELSFRISIIALDMRSEALQCLGTPFIPYLSYGTHARLAVLRASLCAVLTVQPEVPNHQFEIWVMTEYGVEDSWTKQYIVGPFSFVARPVGSWKDGKLLFIKCLNSDIFLSHDVFTKMIDFQYSGSFCFPFLRYIESLESVYGGRRIAPAAAATVSASP